MGELPLISIIVPVYNSEKFLDTCLRSILGQSYGNIEVILINDGSVDGSAKICEKYAQQDKRIKLYHQKNQGVSETRNRGISFANGEYVGFVDADDWIDADMYQLLYDLLTGKDADVAIHSFYVEENGRDRSKASGSNEILVMDSEEAVKEMLLAKRFGGHLCNKLFKRSLLQGICLNKEIAIYEDMLFLWDVFHGATRVVFQDKKVYHYVIHSESALQTVWKDSFFSVFDATQMVLEKTKKEYPKLVPEAQKMVLLSCLVTAMKLHRTKNLTRENYRRVKAVMKGSLNCKSVVRFPEKRSGISVICLWLGRRCFMFYRDVLELRRNNG